MHYLINNLSTKFAFTWFIFYACCRKLKCENMCLIKYLLKSFYLKHLLVACKCIVWLLLEMFWMMNNLYEMDELKKYVLNIFIFYKMFRFFHLYFVKINNLHKCAEWNIKKNPFYTNTYF